MCNRRYGVAVFGEWNLQQKDSVFHVSLHQLHEWNLLDGGFLFVYVAFLSLISISTCYIYHSTNVYWTWIGSNPISLFSEVPGKLSLTVARDNDFCAIMKMIMNINVSVISAAGIKCIKFMFHLPKRQYCPAQTYVRHACCLVPGTPTTKVCPWVSYSLSFSFPISKMKKKLLTQRNRNEQAYLYSQLENAVAKIRRE